MSSDVADDSASPAAVIYTNSCTGLTFGASCGSRYFGNEAFDYAPHEYNFARAGEGYLLTDASNYDISFQWTIDPLEGPEGTIATPRYNSFDFTCGEADANCFFPEW